MVKEERESRLVSVWLPEELYGHFKAAKIAYGFSKNSDFARYIIRRWLEEHWFTFASPRPQLSPPAGVHAELRGSNPGDEPGLGRVVEGVGDGG